MCVRTRLAHYVLFTRGLAIVSCHDEGGEEKDALCARAPTEVDLAQLAEAEAPSLAINTEAQTEAAQREGETKVRLGG